ncbi:cystathionine beta-lyase [Ligilactobacillus salitolerans]|uniref:cysteine-S-conjugate beta-lyase n=1 Tax=Ligilactobacillus salitolerans TaxID=1808352 RepID=A0A401ISN2_9LACO|nr:PatB family C-S lyase [Ligilactobacillus salitolerans]GBG94552.1 cystathionine beta-lyase [Ligilactobacillus salitolerans]
MEYDFDQVIDRHHTYSTQWDYTADRFGSSDVLPFSISDTDFAVPESIQERLKARIEHPIYGYTRWNNPEYKASIVNWFKNRDGVDVDGDWISYSPSVVFSIASFIKLMSEPDDSVAVFTPMYDAFYNVILQNDRRLAPIVLGSAFENYQIDWDTLETVLDQEKTKILLLTNPHNPTGKVFSRTELQRIVEICQKNDVFIISDDIHRDIVFAPNHYVPLTEVTHKNMVLCCSCSKTFNTPGLIGSYLIEPDEDLLQKFAVELKGKNALSSVSILGMEAQIGAYANCEYVDQLVEYVHRNMQYLEEFFKDEPWGMKFIVPQGTYLAWIDVRNCRFDAQELQESLVNKGHVGIMSGENYGNSGFLRMNIACPLTKVQQGLQGIKAALIG